MSPKRRISVCVDDNNTYDMNYEAMRVCPESQPQMKQKSAMSFKAFEKKKIRIEEVHVLQRSCEIRKLFKT